MSETKGAATSETAVERRLRQLHDHIVQELQRQPDDRVTAYCSPPDVTATDAGREALALLRRYKSGELNWLAFDGLVRALLARCEGEK